MLKIANLVFNNFTNDSRVIKESSSLAKHGYDVTVVANLDKNLKKEEKNKNNFLVKRFSYFDRTVTQNKLGKLKAYYFYIKESVSYCKNFDILHCNDIHTLPIGFIIKIIYKRNVKIVYDAHEYETEINGLNGVKKVLMQILEKILIKCADKVITVSDSIANEYVRLYNIEKPVLVLNTPPYKKIKAKNIFREKLNISKNKNIFLYQGVLSDGRGIRVLLDTFKLVDDNKSVIVFMGYGDLEYLIKTTSKKNNNIYFHKAVDPQVLLDYTSSADFGISTIEDICLSYRYCLPNKMFEYLMAEIPVIVSNLDEMKKLVEDNNVGIIAKTNTPHGLKEAINKAVLLDKKETKKNIQKAKAIYNWEEQEKILIKAYKEL